MSDQLRVVLADDEPLASRRLRRMLEREPDVTVVAECETGAAALEAIVRESADLVFLDVQMPEGDGFEVRAAVDDRQGPLVVFVTAFDEYAIRAFDAAALDYLVKPVREERLRTTLTRVRHQLALRVAHRDARVRIVEEHTRGAPGADRGVTTRLLIDRGRHMDVVQVGDIDWVEAADNDVLVHIGAERHRYRRTMESALERLPAHRFIRVHRSAIVNLERVREVHPWFNGNYLLVLADGTKLTTGRTYREQFLERMHLLR